MRRWTSVRGAPSAWSLSPCRLRGLSQKAPHGAPATDDASGISDDLLEVDASRKTIRTADGDLPISPLMDSSFVEARQRFKTPKAKEPPIHKKTKWQRQLMRNPYAQALATPPRYCPVTGVLLPRYFLQDFNLVAHPESGEPWWISDSLASTQPAGTTSQGHVEDAALPDEASLPSSSPAGASPQPKKALGATAYVLARQDLIKAFRTNGSLYRSQERKLLFMNDSADLRPFLSKAVWRDDMDSLVVELSRRRIVEDLIYLSRLCEQDKRQYLVRCDSWEDVKQQKHRGCVLWLGDGQDPSRERLDDADAHDQPEPGPLATLDTGKVRTDRKLPVHNLKLLLGTEHVAHLRANSGILGEGSLFHLGRERTLEVQLRLWKLQGYLFPSLTPAD